MLLRMALIVALQGVTAPVLAADFADPTWPCIQRKVETLSAGLMWAAPIDTAAPQDTADLEKDVREIADLLALRRLSVDELRPTVETFAARYDGNPAVLGQVFEDVFTSLNARRSRIIGGIGDFSLSQIALSERIEAARMQMDAQMTADAPDYDKVDALEEQLDWDQVIFSDRQKSIQYLCETPVIIEKRLFAIAQMLQQMIN
ncbi:hypothetical protein [uncultured Roseobacter sp.]|uniref:hypothetical protein n=1 Tax=uncultured Roseobacter sp. TaxID=114847 RepID=UPI002624D263|nr:hypothetical protein [uncultured Roseobacter sp.]